MAGPEYDRLPGDPIRLQSVSPSRHNRASIESADSDVSYHDTTHIEPFDEKDKRFQDEPRMEEGNDGDGEGYAIESRRLRPRKKSRRVLAVLIAIVGFAAIIGGFAATAFSAPAYSGHVGTKHITMNHVFNGTFSAKSKSLDWVKEAPDGTYSRVNEKGDIVLAHVRNMTEESILVDSSKILDSEGRTLRWQRWGLSADMEYVLFTTDYVKQWRHSSFGNFWVHRLSDGSTFPVTTPSSPPRTKIVKWSPIGHALAYVQDNDLYVVTEAELATGRPSAVRVTDDGSAVVFNGVPDWVYEEEVFSGDSAVWWSPNSQTLAYLRSDEEAVRDYKLQYYNPSIGAFAVNPYPTELDMKYPKPGTPNPLVTVHTFSLSSYRLTREVAISKTPLSWPSEMPQAERIIIEVGWVGDDALLVKEINRAARVGSVVLFQHGVGVGTVVRTLGKDGEESDGGWIDHGQNVVPVLVGADSGYLDIVPNNGFDHIALFSPLDATEPIWVTSGEWEVTSIAGANPVSGKVYFVAANPSIDRHLYSASVPTSQLVSEYTPNVAAMTDADAPGYHKVSMSPGAGYYVLTYAGPEVPWQRVIAVEDDEVNELLEGNGALNDTLAEFMRPSISRITIENEGYELNMLQIFPPNMDTSGRKKYPVLVRVYGGPGSQTVSDEWNRDWHTYLACEMKYIIVTVDGRGTGFKGRALRNPVTDNLGYWEVVDQIAGAREMAKRVYVDRSRIGIWGWSYGGYATLKTIEANSGIFTLGMAVAPVTDYMYYDSIYTERYMNVPSANPGGYVRAAVNNMTAFGEVDLLLAHGSGDDNVHFLNTATLLDKLTQNRTRGWRFRMFTDSAHSMDVRGAYRELYEWMTSFLEEKWGRGGTVHTKRVN